jgi:hypothetical protein
MYIGTYDLDQSRPSPSSQLDLHDPLALHTVAWHYRCNRLHAGCFKTYLVSLSLNIVRRTTYPHCTILGQRQTRPRPIVQETTEETSSRGHWATLSKGFDNLDPVSRAKNRRFVSMLNLVSQRLFFFSMSVPQRTDV